MIRIRPGVDDVANRLRRDALNRADNGGCARRRSCVDDHDTVVPDLDADVRTSAGDHEEVGSYLEHLEVSCRRGTGALSCQRNHWRYSRAAIEHADRGTDNHGSAERKTRDTSASCERHGSVAGKRSTNLHTKRDRDGCFNRCLVDARIGTTPAPLTTVQSRQGGPVHKKIPLLIAIVSALFAL